MCTQALLAQSLEISTEAATIHSLVAGMKIVQGISVSTCDHAREIGSPVFTAQLWPAVSSYIVITIMLHPFLRADC